MKIFVIHNDITYKFVKDSSLNSCLKCCFIDDDNMCDKVPPICTEIYEGYWKEVKE